MVLYLLRHELRKPSCKGFDTNLTMIGKHNSKTRLFNKLINIPIDEIYCSPYVRTLETINILSESKNIPIKIDWAISEFLDDQSRHSLDNVKFPDSKTQDSIHNKYNIDKEYNPVIHCDFINTYNENVKNFEKRVDDFILYVYTKLDKNIIVVTHGSICNRITQKLMGESKNLNMGECFKLDFCKI